MDQGRPQPGRRDLTQQVIEECGLLVGAGGRGFIGAGKMCEQPFDFHTRDRLQRLQQAEGRMRFRSQARHARVHLDVDLDCFARRSGGGRQGIELCLVVDRHRNMVGGRIRHSRVGSFAQDKDRCGDASVANLDRLVDPRHATICRAGLDRRPGSRDQAVAVAVGLDHGHDACVGQLLHGLNVVRDGAQINFKPGR